VSTVSCIRKVILSCLVLIIGKPPDRVSGLIMKRITSLAYSNV